MKPDAPRRPWNGRPPTLVTGTFELKRDRRGGDSKKGGACLVFRPASPTKSCQSQAECVAAANELFDDVPGAYGYCVANGNPASNKTCCYRPPDPPSSLENGLRVSKYCVRSVNPLPQGKVHLPAVHAYPLGVLPTYWRVNTCQSLKPHPENPTLPGCASEVDGITRRRCTVRRNSSRSRTTGPGERAWTNGDILGGSMVPPGWGRAPGELGPWPASEDHGAA